MGRRGGIIQVQAGTTLLEASGEWSYNLGKSKRTANPGSGKINGYHETPQVAFIEGEITDSSTLDLGKLLEATDATVTLRLAVGKTILLPNAWQAAEGTGNTGTAAIGVRFESESQGQEI